MARSIRSPYDSEPVDSSNAHDGVETYRVERTEAIKHNGSTSHDRDGHLVHGHGGNNHGHSIRGNKHEQGPPQNHHRLGENAVPALVQAFSGAVGASIANLAVHPLDLIIKRLQVQKQIRNQLRAGPPLRSVGVSSPKYQSSPSRDPGGAYQQTDERAPRSRSGSPEHVVLGPGDRGRDVERVSGYKYESRKYAVGGSTITEERWTGSSSDFEMEGQYLGVYDAAQKIYAQEGFTGFYTGVVEETVGTLGSAFWYFAVYSYLRNKRLHKRHSQKLPVLEELFIGLAAGSVSKFFLTPFNTIATRKQTYAMLYPNAEAPGIVGIYHDIMREKGITGFWSGYSASAFLSLNPSITFLLYESLKNFAGGKQRKLKGAETFLIAAVAKAIATGLTYPLAVAKSRTQIANEEDFDTGSFASIGKAGEAIGRTISRKARRGRNVIEVLADIFKREGIAGLYEGVLGELLRGFVSSGITMVIKESVHRTILSLYYFVMRAYNRTEDHTFHSTTKLMAKDAYDKAGPRQKKLLNKAIEGVEKVEAIASHGKAKVAGLVGASHAAGKLSEVREKITEHAGIRKHRQESNHHGGMKTVAAAAAAASLAAGAAHAHKRNERHDEHGNVIVHTARERVEEWREGVGEDSRDHTGKVSHSGHIIDDRIHTGEMRQDVHETRTHSGSGHVGSRIGRNHNDMTEHTRIEEHVQHGHSGTSSHSRRGSAVAGVVGAATAGHNLSSHSHTEHSHSSNAGGVAGAATETVHGHKLPKHSRNENAHSSHGGHAAGVVGAVAGAALGHKLSNHEHSHSGHTGGVVGAATGAVTGAVLGQKLSKHSHNEHSRNDHSGHAAGVVSAVTGAALGHKLSSHSQNEHGHSHSGRSHHGGDVVSQTTTTKVVEEFDIIGGPRTPLVKNHHEGHQAVTDSRARFGEISHHEHISTHEPRGREYGGIIGAVTGAAEKITGHSHSNSSRGRSHSGSHHNLSTADLVHKVTGAHSHGHNSHSRDGQAIAHTETVKEWRDEANAVEDLRQFGVASTVHEDSRSDFGETLHKGHSIVGHSHRNRFGDDAVAHDSHGHGHGHTVVEKTQITRMGETIHDGGHRSHSHDSHGRRHNESRSKFGDVALHADGRTIVEKTEVTRIGETLHNGGHRSHSHSSHGHKHNDSALHIDGRMIAEKTEVTRIGETIHGGDHHSHPHGSHGHRHNESYSSFGGDSLHTDGRTIVEKTQITRIDETLGDEPHRNHGHSYRHNDSTLHIDGRTIIEETETTRISETSRDGQPNKVIPIRSPLSCFEDAAINKVVEKTQVTRFGETQHDAGHHHHHQRHRSHSSHSHGHDNGATVSKAGCDNAITRTTIREAGWLGKKALANNAASTNAASINTAAATVGTNGVTTITRTEEFWPIDEDARSSVYNFLDEETKETAGGATLVETRTAEERWWDNKRGKGYN